MKQKFDEEILKQLGENIRKLRIQQNISQSQLAFESNTTLRQIQRIEKGGYNAGILYYLVIAEALNTTLCDLTNVSKP